MCPGIFGMKSKWSYLDFQLILKNLGILTELAFNTQIENYMDSARMEKSILKCMYQWSCINSFLPGTSS